jgi:cell division protein FtsN
LGEYVVADAMEKDREKLRQAGLTPVVKQGPKKSTPMVRLLVGEFDNPERAQQALQKLRDATVEGFMLSEGGKYRVYAGSYASEGRAIKEKERLAALGVSLSLRKATVAVPTLLLTTGNYPNRAAAEKDAAKLKQKGLRPVVIGQVK